MKYCYAIFIKQICATLKWLCVGLLLDTKMHVYIYAYQNVHLTEYGKKYYVYLSRIKSCFLVSNPNGLDKVADLWSFPDYLYRLEKSEYIYRSIGKNNNSTSLLLKQNLLQVITYGWIPFFSRFNVNHVLWDAIEDDAYTQRVRHFYHTSRDTSVAMNQENSNPAEERTLSVLRSLIILNLR